MDGQIHGRTVRGMLVVKSRTGTPIICILCSLLLANAAPSTVLKKYEGRHEWISQQEIVVLQCVDAGDGSPAAYQISRVGVSPPSGQRTVTPILQGTGDQLSTMAVSPDRRYLSLSLWDESTDSRGEIRFIDLESAEGESHSVFLAAGAEAGPAIWSPDGEGVYGVSSRSGVDDVLFYAALQAGATSEILRRKDIWLLGFVGDERRLRWATIVDDEWKYFEYDPRSGESREFSESADVFDVSSSPYPVSVFQLSLEGTAHSLLTGATWQVSDEGSREFTGYPYYDNRRGILFLDVDVIADGTSVSLLRVFEADAGRRLRPDIRLPDAFVPVGDIRTSPDGSLCSVGDKHEILVYDWRRGVLVDTIPTVVQE